MSRTADAESAAEDRPSRGPMPWALSISAALTGFLIWWIYWKDAASAEGIAWVAALPAVNATMNTLAAACLVGGFAAIRRGQTRTHQRFMMAALGFSALFLASYLTYHHFHGDTKFPGQGWIRPVYFAVLISHIILSVIMLPMILTTLAYAAKKNFVSHRRIARYTLPVWLYVSVTGVALFFILRAHISRACI